MVERNRLTEGDGDLTDHVAKCRRIGDKPGDRRQHRRRHYLNHVLGTSQYNPSVQSHFRT